ncbi:hypothetical protein LGQ02_05090 [Bacillus shivajii]|uniref:hypothetical protein n=1 Tax=Bacillus shivajii TaxID=1983719 RepID=UPI001CF9B600|nr:hypothetical protein [Bacillus shivajii]UCZ54140.1 hypothetical protein LGQ02_05090 [Bacillus shivajii]
MIKVGDTVYVNKLGRSEYVGKGTVQDICTDIQDLDRFFDESHPFHSTYLSWLKKGKDIYIVDLESNIGKAGFLVQELSHELVKN